MNEDSLGMSKRVGFSLPKAHETIKIVKMLEHSQMRLNDQCQMGLNDQSQMRLNDQNYDLPNAPKRSKWGPSSVTARGPASVIAVAEKPLLDRKVVGGDGNGTPPTA